MSAELRLQSAEEARVLLGPLDRNAKLLHESFGVDLVYKGDLLKILGEAEDVTRARSLLDRALRLLRKGHSLSPGQLERWVQGEPPGVDEGASEPADRGAEPPTTPAPSSVRPRTPGQKNYLEAIRGKTIVLVFGPAGTGKTYLAVAAAVEALRAGRFRRIVLARPAVEAGEKLGFLPGDFQAKVNPYLRPLYDALGELLDPALAKRYIENDVVEVCPLAFMRGRTLNNAFVILDEAQNTTISQMRMCLTRLGEQSQLIVTGDVTQVDLPPGTPSGLVDAVDRLKGIDGLAVVRLSPQDIVRHPIVQDIVDAYERSQGRSPSPEDREANPVRKKRRKR